MILAIVRERCYVDMATDVQNVRTVSSGIPDVQEERGEEPRRPLRLGLFTWLESKMWQLRCHSLTPNRVNSAPKRLGPRVSPLSAIFSNFHFYAVEPRNCALIRTCEDGMEQSCMLKCLRIPSPKTSVVSRAHLPCRQLSRKA